MRADPMRADTVDRDGIEFGIAESRAGSVNLVVVQGPIDVSRTCLLGHRLLAALNEGARRIVLDLSRAEPLATGVLLGTVLRLDRYASHRDARLVVVSGEPVERMFEAGRARDLITIAETQEEADALLTGWPRGREANTSAGRR